MAETKAAPAPHTFELEFVARLEGRLEPVPLVIGPTSEGLRINFPISGGTVDGPRLKATVIPGGADYYRLRPDGVALIDVHATLKTDDGAVIYVEYRGVSDMGEDGYEKGLQGQMPDVIRLHVAPRFHTAHPSYLWMNRRQFIGIGESRPGSNLVAYDLYAIK
jgi:hypothetical protein